MTKTRIKTYRSLFFKIVLYVIGVILFSGLSFSVVLLIAPSISELWKTIIMQFNLLLSVVIFSFVWFKIDHQSFISMGLSMKGRAKDLLYGCAIASLLLGSGFTISLLLGVITIESIRLSINNLLLSFLFFILVSLTEEIMCRGVILGQMLHCGIHRYLSLAVSSLVFAAMHILNPNVTFLSIINIFVAGVMLGVTYLFTRNLWFPISLHLFWNWIQGPILGFDVSGISWFSSVFRLSIPNNNIWNGGQFGFEGSILCTILMLCYIAIVIWHRETKSQFTENNSQSF